MTSRSPVQTELRRWVPRWWRGEAGPAGSLLMGLLLPAELGFRGVVRSRNALYDQRRLRVARAEIPVISIGNLSVGGTGKTPVSAMIAARLRDRGRAPAIVMRGYGRDEAAVHRELNPDVPVYLAAQRIDAIEAATADGRDCAILDDAFQHRRVHRDLDVVLVAAELWDDRPRLLPRGPWREPPSALGRAGLVLVTRKTASASAARSIAGELQEICGDTPLGIVFLAPTRLVPLGGTGNDATTLESLQGEDVLAVSSLADPGPFAQQLRGAGADAELAIYPDHHEFSADDLGDIARQAGGRTIVVTRKEAVKLRGLPPSSRVLVLDQEVRFEMGESELDAALQRALWRG